MNIAPARVAGVEDIMLVSPSSNGFYNPPTSMPSALNVSRFKFGRPSNSRNAYGTKVEKVNKITGPGNEYVAEQRDKFLAKLE